MKNLAIFALGFALSTSFAIAHDDGTAAPGTDHQHQGRTANPGKKLGHSKKLANAKSKKMKAAKKIKRGKKAQEKQQG